MSIATLPNDYVVRNILRGQSKSFFSVAGIETDDELERNNYPREFVNSLTPAGLPPHEPDLKPGTVAMLTRNLNENTGPVNGTMVVVKNLFTNCLDVEVLTGEG